MKEVKKIQDCLAIPPDQFLTQVYKGEYTWQDAMVAVGLWVHREDPVDQIVKLFEEEQVPTLGLLSALMTFYKHRLWTSHPLLIAKQVKDLEIEAHLPEGVSLDDVLEKLERGEDCFCGKCGIEEELEAVSDQIH